MEIIGTDEVRDLELTLGELETDLPAAGPAVGTCRGVYCI